MATSIPHSLSRALRRGTVPTKTLAAGEPPRGAFSESEGHADGAAAVMGALPVSGGVKTKEDADALFAELFKSDASVATDAQDEELSDLGQQPAAPPVESAETPVASGSQNRIPGQAPGRVASHRAVSRAQRFASREPVPNKANDGERPKADADRPAETDAPAAVPVAPAQATVAARSTRYGDPKQAPEAVNARRSMAAAKVITPLVAAVSFAPGTASSGTSKSKALSEMLVGMHRCAVDTAEAISAQTAQDVPAWLLTQLMAGLSTAIATRWQRGQGADLHALSHAMKGIFSGDDPAMASLIQGASEDAYVEVNHPDVARFRISVSAANAAWTIYDWVTHDCLSLDSAGEMPSRFFTYNLPTHEVVNKILTRCVNECRALVVQVESADLRTAHMQSSIGRMANLMGTEYVTRTRAFMNWIGDPSIDDAEYMRRHSGAAEDLEGKVLPAVFEYARVNFLRIEQGALSAIEDLNEQSKNSQSGSGVSDRAPSA